MLHFHYSSLIEASPEVVWQFYERENILQLLTPPWQPVEIVRSEGGLGVGAVSEFRLWLGSLPVRWIARGIESKPNELYVDRTEEGPMQSWLHYHRFARQGSKTRLTDAIEYELPGGMLAELFLGWWVNSRLQDMFRYRHQVTKRECDCDR